MRIRYKITLAKYAFTYATDGVVLDGAIKARLMAGYKPEDFEIEVEIVDEKSSSDRPQGTED